MTSTALGVVDTISPMPLPEKLAQLEKLKGYVKRRQALAEELGVSKSTLGRWFSGESIPSIQDAFKLANTLDVPLEFLADDSLEEPPAKEELTEAERIVLDAFRDSGIKPHEAVMAILHAKMPLKPPG